MEPDEWFSCARKVRYGHEATAQRAVEAMKAKTVKSLEAYKCNYCDGWHIGRKRSGWLIQLRLWE